MRIIWAMRKRTTDDIEKDKLEAKLEDSIYLRVIDFGLGYPDGFTFRQAIEGLKLEGWEQKTIEEYFYNAYSNDNSKRGVNPGGSMETPFFLIQRGGGNYQDDTYRYIISYDANFKFIDYYELKFARANAKEARTLATIAIAVSVGAVLVSIFMPIFVAQWFTQNVRLDDDQLKSLERTYGSSTTTVVSK
jgi:hypothetical protein